MRPLFFVQNNFVERLTIPVARFAHARGVSVQDRSCSSGFDPLACGVDWSEHHPVLPYGSVQFMRKLKAAGPLSRYVHHEEVRFSAQVWQEQLPCMLNAQGRVVRVQDVASTLADAPAHPRTFGSSPGRWRPPGCPRPASAWTSPSPRRGSRSWSSTLFIAAAGTLPPWMRYCRLGWIGACAICNLRLALPQGLTAQGNFNPKGIQAKVSQSESTQNLACRGIECISHLL